MNVLDLLVELDFPVGVVSCEYCDNPARFRVVVHDCRRWLGCEKCVKKWEARNSELAQGCSRRSCARCRRIFTLEKFGWVEPL